MATNERVVGAVEKVDACRPFERESHDTNPWEHDVLNANHVVGCWRED